APTRRTFLKRSSPSPLFISQKLRKDTMSSHSSQSQGVEKTPTNMDELYGIIQEMRSWDYEHMQAWFEETLGDVEYAQPIFEEFFKPGSDPAQLPQFKNVFFEFATHVISEMESESVTSEEPSSGDDDVSESTAAECSSSSSSSSSCEGSPRSTRRSLKLRYFSRQKPATLMDGSDADDEMTDSANSSMDQDSLHASVDAESSESSEEENIADSSFEEDDVTIRRAFKRPRIHTEPIIVNLSSLGPFHQCNTWDCRW
ncbi:unnamed protein product, partial [Allacma fusca]